MLGPGTAPASPSSLPDIAGLPGKKVLAATDEESDEVGSINPKLNDISELGNPVMEAGFQWMAPAASNGQATAAPPIDSLTVLTPRSAIPCPHAGPPTVKIVVKTNAFKQ